MAKEKTVYVCQECGFSYIKWQGQCSSCGAWGSLVEEMAAPARTPDPRGPNWTAASVPLPLHEIALGAEQRISTPDAEMNRVLGGGVVAGSVVLLGGEPGIGKSTLLLQLALQLKGRKILYVSGEESSQQIRIRAGRISHQNETLYVATETSVERIADFFVQLQPELLVIDSIQTMHTQALESSPGSVSQVRESAARLIRLAKDSNVPIFLVGHITKDGSLAGPKVLEHMVDCVLTFEGDRHNSYRMVRTAKNRFGSTMEIGIYEMMSWGLREVSNPSEVFLSGSDPDYSGVAISATLEGLRPLLIETQALVSPAAYSTAQRSSTGFDLRRLSMLLAVLEKRCGFAFGNRDVFVNLIGGLKIEDPALDLALVCALISSLHDLGIPRDTVFAAEVGLSGEIRPVNRLEPRLAEAAKLGFRRIFVAQAQAETLARSYEGMEVRGVSRLEEVFRSVFGG